VLFWGILGVFVGGRLGWVLFYGMHEPDWSWAQILQVWKGGMSFHGGLLGVIVAYGLYCRQQRLKPGAFFDGLALAATPGLFLVRLANFINAELYGRVWDGPWAMRFPDYEAPGVGGPEHWVPGGPMLADTRHPSQLYEAFGEGLFLLLFLGWLMVRRGVGGGRIAGLFLVLYGGVRFLIEFTREPDAGIGFSFLGWLTRGQELCVGMVLAGLIVLALCGKNDTRSTETEPA
jgi:phosphatidylglycerol---prolipoprotein diacylglyceryl transferase